MKKNEPKTEPKKTDDKPADQNKPVIRKDRQRSFDAPGVERQKS
jgi:hypothetical protein